MMSLVSAVVIVALLVNLLVTTCVVFGWAPWRRHPVRERVSVTLTDGSSVMGVQLRRLTDGGLLLAAVTIAEQEPGERVRTTALDGDVAIPGRRIRFVQRLGAETPDTED